MRFLSPRKGLIFLWGVALFAWWIRYHPPGVDLLVFDDDARQHVYWTARFQDPTLFPDDLLTSFISSRLFDPPGYRLIYQLGVQFMDPLPFSQLLTLLLLLLSLWLLDQISKEIIPHPRGRLFLGGLFLFFSLYDASGGFPRSFVFPLLLLFLLLLQKRAFLWAAATVLLQAVLYPPIILNTLALAGWDLLRRLIQGPRDRRWLRDFLFLAAVIAVVALLLHSIYGEVDRGTMGKQVTLEEARAMPEFHPGGRSSFFRDNLVSYLLIGRSGIGAIHLIGFAIILATMGLVAGPRAIRLPSLALHLCWTSLLLFALAHLVLFRLHLPSRYTLFTLPLAFMLAIGDSTGGFLEALKPAWARLRRRIPSSAARRWVGWGAFGILLLVYTYLQGHVICRFDRQVVALEPVDREMLAFLESLPKESLVAGHPMDMDSVPLLSRRPVLANRELSLPYYMRYYRQVRRRLMDMLGAYYARRWEDVTAFVERYRVSAMVVRKTYFEPPFLEGRIYLEPFNSAIKAGWEGRTGGFVLADPPRELRCFENERYVVLCWAKKAGG